MFSEEKLTPVSNFKPEDQGCMFLQNVATHLVNCNVVTQNITIYTLTTMNISNSIAI